MITITTKKIKEQPSEITIDRSEVTIIRHLPSCPKCKQTEDIFFFNVTSEVYECLRCNLRFRFAH
jgi:hypothetical protein